MEHHWRLQVHFNRITVQKNGYYPKLLWYTGLTSPKPGKIFPQPNRSALITFCNQFRNPKAPWRDNFLNLEPKAWEAYDIDWPEFNAANLNYLNIGIPPVVNQKYKQKYMNFWNQYLPEELNRTIYSSKSSHNYPDLFAPSLTVYARGTTASPFGSRVNYYPEKTTEDPLRTLKLLLNRPNLNRTDMYNTQQSTVLTTTAPDSDPVQHTESENEIVVKADATLGKCVDYA